MTDKEKYIKEARAKFNSYDENVWIKDGAIRIGNKNIDIYGFDENSGGYVVVHNGHKFDPDTGEFEIKTANILAQKGYKVEMMDESNFEKPQYDIDVDGFRFILFSLSSTSLNFRLSVLSVLPDL